jgi:hypothetical protein
MSRNVKSKQPTATGLCGFHCGQVSMIDRINNELSHIEGACGPVLFHVFKVLISTMTGHLRNLMGQVSRTPSPTPVYWNFAPKMTMRFGNIILPTPALL